MSLDGIHHVTCITGDAPRNVDFYARVLGLRMRGDGPAPGWSTGSRALSA